MVQLVCSKFRSRDFGDTNGCFVVGLDSILGTGARQPNRDEKIPRELSHLEVQAPGCLSKCGCHVTRTRDLGWLSTRASE